VHARTAAHYVIVERLARRQCAAAEPLTAMSRSTIGYNEAAQETMKSMSNVTAYLPACNARRKLLR
jgi:hypothetical protein